MKWLVRLYPARWRRRYEAEFLAFLEEEGKLPLAHRLDLLRALLDAHVVAWRDRLRGLSRMYGGLVRQPANAGTGVLLAASDNGGMLMRRQPLAALFLLLGLALGLLAPYARQTVDAAFSSPPASYTALIYQNFDVAPEGRIGVTTIDIVNTGRPIPRLWVVLPANRAYTLEARRDHRIILSYVVRLGHGLAGYSMCPLAPGQTAQIYISWPRSVMGDHLPFTYYARRPNLTHGYDPQAAIHSSRS